MADVVRIGIIGTGGMANGHARRFNEIEGSQVVSCLDLIPERASAFAQKHEIPHVAESIEALLDRVDAVSVVTPDRFHRAPSLAALAAGKHLLCEKPLSVTLAEAQEMAAAAVRSGRIHMINFSYRESAAFQRAIRLREEGALGALRHVHASYLQTWLSSDVWGSWTREALVWRLQASQSGGVLGDIGCHILDMATAVAGDVARARCTLRTFPKVLGDDEVTEYEGKPLDVNDTAIIELEFTDGGLGVVHTTRWATGHANHLRCEVHGTRGALHFDLDEGYGKIATCLGEAVHRCGWTVEDLAKTPDNYARFITAIQTGKADQPDTVRGAQVQAYLDACERSAVSGQWEDVATDLRS